MTDVVKVAKECREALAVEIAKLDEFLLLAEKLLNFKQSDSGKSWEIGDKEAPVFADSAKVSPYSAATGQNGPNGPNRPEAKA
jgi:hypothetical protein